MQKRAQTRSDLDQAATPPGPVPLDPSLFEQVGGGLPRGGWGAEEATELYTTNDGGDLPRGGW